jgi:hypothetical protein
LSSAAGMKSYILAYFGEPKFDGPEQAAAQRKRWEAWVDALGDAVVDPGTPLGRPKTVSASGVVDDGASRLLGFSIVKATSIDVAIGFAKVCPYLEQGTIDVAEIMRMAP